MRVAFVTVILTLYSSPYFTHKGTSVFLTSYFYSVVHSFREPNLGSELRLETTIADDLIGAHCPPVVELCLVFERLWDVSVKQLHFPTSCVTKDLAYRSSNLESQFITHYR